MENTAKSFGRTPLTLGNSVSGVMPIVTSTKACVPCRARKTKCDAATTGLPCSGCVSRKCPEQCVVSARKRRKRAGDEDAQKSSSTPAPTAATAAASKQLTHTTSASTAVVARQPRGTSIAWDHNADTASRQALTPDSVDKRQSQTQLHYFHILKEAVDDDALHGQSDKTGPSFSGGDSDLLSPPGQPWYSPPQLSDIDKEYLSKKGIFDLPPKRCLVSLIANYFAYVDPSSPVIDKLDFINKYESGNCSLFLLYALLATASLYVPPEAITACGFVDRSDAQATFAARATLLHDFQFETDLLPALQGSLIMTKVLLEQPTDKDSNYWFYNGLRLATKLEIYSFLNRCSKSDSNCSIYKRIAWVLYTRHIFHLVSEFRNVAYLSSLPPLEPLERSDWHAEPIPPEFQDIVPPTLEQHVSLFTAHCEMSAIYGGILSAIAQDPSSDLQQLMRPLDAWRMSLPAQLQIANGSPNGDIYYIELQGTSYRYEATICRLLQRHLRGVDAARSDWAKQRLRSAMFELDAITGRMLANGMLAKVPISLMTAMPALLALHVESALDQSESDIVQSMSRISISQTMLALNQLREIPAIKKAIPLFEVVLARKSLYGDLNTVMQNYPSQIPPPGEPVWGESGAVTRSQQQLNAAEQQDAPGEASDSFIPEFLEYDMLDRWDFGQLDFSRVA